MDADGERLECVHIANDAVRDTSWCAPAFPLLTTLPFRDLVVERDMEPAHVAFAGTRRSLENRIREHLQGLVRRGDGDRVGARDPVAAG